MALQISSTSSSLHASTVEVGVGEARQCRICLEEEIVGGCALISPCDCAGTSGFVHRNCLDQWRTAEQRTDALTHCSECRFKYKLRTTGGAEELAANRVRYRRRVARDTGAALIVLLCAVAGLCGAWAVLDAYGLVRGRFVPAAWGSAGAAVLLGLVSFFVLVALVGLTWHATQACSPQARGAARRVGDSSGFAPLADDRLIQDDRAESSLSAGSPSARSSPRFSPRSSPRSPSSPSPPAAEAPKEQRMPAERELVALSGGRAGVPGTVVPLAAPEFPREQLSPLPDRASLSSAPPSARHEPPSAPSACANCLERSVYCGGSLACAAGCDACAETAFNTCGCIEHCLSCSCCQPAPGRAREGVGAREHESCCWGAGYYGTCDCGQGCICSDCECADCAGGSAEGMVAVTVIALIVLVVIGALFFAVFAVDFIRRSHLRHNHLLERKILAEFYIVCDRSCAGEDHRHASDDDVVLHLADA